MRARIRGGEAEIECGVSIGFSLKLACRSLPIAFEPVEEAVDPVGEAVAT